MGGSVGVRSCTNIWRGLSAYIEDFPYYDKHPVADHGLVIAVLIVPPDHKLDFVWFNEF